MATSAPHVLELLETIHEFVSPLATGQPIELDSPFTEKVSFAAACIKKLNERLTDVEGILSHFFDADGKVQLIDKAKVEEYMSLFDQINGPRQQPEVEVTADPHHGNVAEKVIRNGGMKTCSRCHQAGHNRRNCELKVCTGGCDKPSLHESKRKRGRPLGSGKGKASKRHHPDEEQDVKQEKDVKEVKEVKEEKEEDEEPDKQEEEEDDGAIDTD